MTRYEIPLHPWEDDYDEKQGVYLIISGMNIHLLDYDSDKPHDMITLSEYELLPLIRILTTWLASVPRLRGEFEDEYGEYDEDR